VAGQRFSTTASVLADTKHICMKAISGANIREPIFGSQYSGANSEEFLVIVVTLVSPYFRTRFQDRASIVHYHDVV